MIRKSTMVLGLAFALLPGVAAMPSVAVQESIVLAVGIEQPPDSLNVTVGVLVVDYEVWNLQYATLTDKAAADFATEPGLAESWEQSDEEGLVYTYTLREGLTWSDGTPLTAEDVAWTVNTSRDQEWLNHSSTTTNLTAEVIDARTVTITTAVPDPKLPTIDVYILPKHIWEPFAADDITLHDGLDGVGSGPFVLDEFEPEQFIRMRANPGYWKGVPTVDEIVFQIYSNPDAMAAALQNGDIDAAHDLPPNAIADLGQDPNITVIEGHQGGFDELAINVGAGLAEPHPALLDLTVRQAIAHAIDKEALVEDVLFGLGEPALGISPSADPKWRTEVPEGERYGFDPDLANQMLDDAGYLDTDGDGIREMPDGTNPLVLRHGVLTDSNTYPQIAEFFVGWMAEIGITVETANYDSGQLVEVIGTGEYHLCLGLDALCRPRPDVLLLHHGLAGHRSRGPHQLLQRCQLVPRAI